MNIYQVKGYTNRREYLEELASDYGVELETIFALASVLGESEDFDGLLMALEDAENF